MADGAVGRPPYAAVLRLAGLTARFWPEIDGYASLRGGNLLNLPPARFFNAVYTWAIQRVEEREQWDAMLNEPIPGIGGQDAGEAPARELEDFGSFAATMTAG